MSIERAAEVGRRVNGHPEAVDAALPELEALFVAAIASGDVDLLWQTLEALGHCWDPRAVRIVLAHADIAHPDPEIREELAHVLGCWSGDDDAGLRTQVADALIALSRDDDARVRDWACFGLGQIEADSPAVRGALAARLADRDVDTRCEALVALAGLRDPRALAATMAALAGDSDRVWSLELESAIRLADPSLRPVLLRLRDAWRDDDDDSSRAVEVALRVLEPGVDREREYGLWKFRQHA